MKRGVAGAVAATEGYDGGMPVMLFAGIPVSDYAASLAWYQRLLGSPPAFLPNEVEAVWEVAEHRYVYIEVRPAHAGHAMHTVLVDDLVDRVSAISGRGIESSKEDAYSGMRKVFFFDPDGNEFCFGGAAG